MKSKANAVRLKEQDEDVEGNEELQALLDLIEKQAELDKKLRALLIEAIGD